MGHVAKQVVEEPDEGVADWRDTSLKRSPLDKLLQECADIRTTIKELKEREKGLSTSIGKLLSVHGLKAVRCAQWTARWVTTHKPRRVDTVKLLGLGVKQSIINKATVGGEEYEQFRIFEEREP